MSDWRVRGVDQVALVNAYYDGAVHVRETTLRPPNAPFFRLSSAGSESCASDARARKKRKRHQQQQSQLDQLIASGKFVPLGDDVTEALQYAHEFARRDDGWRVERVGGDTETNENEQSGDAIDAHVVSADSHANTSRAIELIVHNHEICVLPPQSQFVVGDVRLVLRTEATRLGVYQFILMDPPWENKSVDRKRCYATFHHRELLKLPIDHVSDDGCVLAIWVTNRPTYSAFVLEELLAHWGFTYHATWYWLKVCTSGELVSPLGSPHRLPVEKLVVATRASTAETRERLLAQLGSTPRVVVSVPLRHSWKPPPESFFDAATLSGRNLELFARELRPRFTSVGNEPLKFQTISHFNKGTGRNNPSPM